MCDYLKPPLLRQIKLRITSFHVTKSYVWVNGTAMPVEMWICINKHTLNILRACSQYINNTVCILGKQVVLADLSADVKHWCIAYDNLALQYLLVQLACAELQQKCL